MNKPPSIAIATGIGLGMGNTYGSVPSKFIQLIVLSNVSPKHKRSSAKSIAKLDGRPTVVFLITAQLLASVI